MRLMKTIAAMMVLSTFVLGSKSGSALTLDNDDSALSCWVVTDPPELCGDYIPDCEFNQDLMIDRDCEFNQDPMIDRDCEFNQDLMIDRDCELNQDPMIDRDCDSIPCDVLVDTQ